MYIRYDEILENQGISSYLKPFSKNLWCAILIFIAIIGTSTLILTRRDNSDFGFLSACYHPLEAFINQGNQSLRHFYHNIIKLKNFRIFRWQ